MADFFHERDLLLLPCAPEDFDGDIEEFFNWYDALPSEDQQHWRRLNASMAAHQAGVQAAFAAMVAAEWRRLSARDRG